MRTRSRSRHKIAEPLRIEFHSQENQFQEDPPVATMPDNRTMTEMIRAPTEGDVTTAMTAMLRQFQATPPPAPVKAVEETCVTCGGAHPYYQCLAADGNTFPEFRDNIQEYGSTAATNYNQGNPGYRPQGVANQIRPPGFAQSNA
nr:hypothetical protein [Tanacetum cinerariifolium]